VATKGKKSKLADLAMPYSFVISIVIGPVGRSTTYGWQPMKE